MIPQHTHQSNNESTNELLELKQLKKLNPQDDEPHKKTFLAKFDWSQAAFSPEERQQIEEFFLEFHDIFAKHRFDIGKNRQFKVKLPPNDDRTAYSQRLTTHINPKDDITVELSLSIIWHYYNLALL